MALDTDIRKWEETVKSNPDDAEAHYQLGCVYEKYGVYSACVLINKAVKNWRRARNIDPKLIEAQGPLVYGDTNERIEELERTLEQIPEEVTTLSLLGNAYCQKGFETRLEYSKKAIEELVKAIELDPEHKDAKNIRSAIMLALRDELYMIEHDFGKVENLEACDLNQAELHYKLGDDYFTKGNYTRIMEEYKKAIFGYHKFQIDKGAEKIAKILSFPLNMLKAFWKCCLMLIGGH